MTIRTREKTVTFKKPFDLEGYPDMFPAGTYRVETDEELLEGVSFTVYRRKSTILHLLPNADRPGRRQSLTIDPDRLDAALMRDRMSAEGTVDQDPVPGKSEPSEGSRREYVDRRAIEASIEASEDDGSVIRPT